MQLNEQALPAFKSGGTAETSETWSGCRTHLHTSEVQFKTKRGNGEDERLGLVELPGQTPLQ